MDDFTVLLVLVSTVLTIIVFVTFFKLCGRVRDIRNILMAGFDVEEARNEYGGIIKGVFRQSQPVVHEKAIV